MKRWYFFFVGFIFFIAFVLRFYKLGEVPLGFYQDESAIGYNAYSIMETGKDEYGKFLPLYFKSFGDYKLPVYIYSTIIPIKLFGLNEFAVRFPSAFFGFLTIVVFYFFIKEITKDKMLSFIATTLLTVNPWHLHYSRATFEVSISLFLFVLGGLLLLKSFKKSYNFLFGTLCFILALYTYNLTRLLAPFLYLFFIFFYKKNFLLISKKVFILTLFLSFIFFSPFIITFFEKGGVFSASGTLIFSSVAVKAPLLEFRSYLIDLPDIFTKVFFNVGVSTVWQYINNALSYFSVTFFFISGSSHGNHGIGNVGQFYIFEFIFIVFGIIKAIQEKKIFCLFTFWGLIIILVASLTRESPHATRSFFLIVPMEFFSASGIIYLVSIINRGKKLWLKIAIFGFISIFVFYNLIYYLASYYVRFPILYAKLWRLEDKALSLYLKENQSKYNKIIFDKESGFVYSSLLFYLQFSPAEFQKSVVRSPDDSEGFSSVYSFGKYEFRNIDWMRDYRSLTKNLIVTNVERKPSDVESLKTFSYPKRPVVLAVKQKIIQYPVEDIAYVVIESK